MVFKNIKCEQRKEKRHYCNWPIWFATGSDDKFFYGDIVDFSSDSLSLISKNNIELLQPGCAVKLHFGYAQIDLKKSSGVEIFSCVGNIYRINILGKKFFRRKNRITIRLSESLPFTPCQIKALNVIFEVLSDSEVKERMKLSSVTSANGID
jgi:hypothetical protein